MTNTTSTAARLSPWFGGRGIIGFWAWLKAARLFYAGTQTEYAGPGRIRFWSFFGGAGYVLRMRSGRGWDGRPLDERGLRLNVYIPGFTIYWRTAGDPKRWAAGVRKLRITRDGNALFQGRS